MSKTTSMQCRIELWSAPGQICRSAPNISKTSSEFLCNFSLKWCEVSVQFFVSFSRNYLENFRKFPSKCFFFKFVQSIPYIFSKFFCDFFIVFSNFTETISEKLSKNFFVISTSISNYFNFNQFCFHNFPGVIWNFLLNFF